MLETALYLSAVSSSLNMGATPMNSDSFDWSSGEDNPDKVTKHSDILDITEPQVCGEVPRNNFATQICRFHKANNFLERQRP